MNSHGRGGFTLVEVLVALSLLAIVGLIAWRGLDHVSAQRARADADTAATDRMLRTLAQIDRDLGQRIPDALFAGRYSASGVLPLALQVATDEEGRVRLRVLRRLPGALGVRYVTYAVEGSKLMRYLAAEDAKRDPDAVLMLDAVRRMDVRFLVAGQWAASRLVQNARSRATAIEFAIERESGERYVEVLQL
jgi:general secretion pathway protein J